MAINLEAPDLRKKYEEGSFPRDGWEIEAEKSAEKAAKQVSRGLWAAFGFILFATLIALCVGYLFGSIHRSLSINYSLLLTFIGTRSKTAMRFSSGELGR